jgi:hypothetical protein
MRAFRCSHGSQSRYRGDQFLGSASLRGLYGSLGFYLGANIPLLSSSRTVSNTGSGPKAIALVSAIGTFVAAVAALVSVHMIIFDDSPAAIWNVGIGFGWALGVLLQLAAGTAARLGQYSSAPGLGPRKTSEARWTSWSTVGVVWIAALHSSCAGLWGHFAWPRTTHQTALNIRPRQCN